MAPSTLSPAFSPAYPGTPESVWDAALKHEKVLEFPCATVVVVSPHPDDEVFGAGGLIRVAAQAGHFITVLCVTDGEAAYPDWRGLDKIRCREVRDALSVLAPHRAATHHLKIPDGRVNQHRASLFDAIDRRISRDILLVAPYERDGHPDHDAAGEVCCEIARRRGTTLWRYPIWSWHHSSPERFAGKRWGCLPLDAAAVRAKARAMSCFTSQMRPLGREPIVPSHVLAYFTRQYEAFLV
jgi:LmbE family N-acetylglucosaminyl deacetylase